MCMCVYTCKERFWKRIQETINCNYLWDIGLWVEGNGSFYFSFYTPLYCGLFCHV